MFGRSPRLPVDLAFGLPVRDAVSISYSQYVQNLRSRLEESYQLASKNASKPADRNKMRFDQCVKPSTLEKGDRVLVRNVRLRGKHKLEDKWEKDIYVVISRAGDLPVYTVQPENNPSARSRTLHRDLLLPCGFLPACEEPELPRATAITRPQTRSLKKTVADSEERFSEEEDWRPYPVPISSPLTFWVEGTLPNNSSSCQDTVPESTSLPEDYLLSPAIRESSQTVDILDPSSSQEDEEEAVPEEPEGERAMELALPGPVHSIVPEGGPELQDPVETSPDPAVALLSDSPETVMPVIDSGGGDAVETVEPDQPVRHSSRQRQPPERLQYSVLGKPLTSIVQTRLHSLASAYDEALSATASSLMYVPASLYLACIGVA